MQSLHRQNLKFGQHTMHMTSLPNGTYPCNDEELMGWIKVYIYSPDYQACYVKRDDFNMDIKIFQVTRDKDHTVTSIKLAPDNAIVCCRMRSDNAEAQDENAANAEAQPVATPVREFKHQPHCIRNLRSSTGYK